jgi:hypothetical protein
MSSCYHEFPGGGNGGGGGGGGGNGTAFVNVTITSTPSSTFSFVALNLQIGAMNLITSSGTSTPLVSGSLPLSDFVRMQTDSVYLGHGTVAATSYTKLQVQFGTPLTSYFYNGGTSSLLGCAVGTVCTIPSTVTGFGATTITVPITFTPSANSKTGIRINFDLSKAVTATGGMTFDFTQTGAVTLTTLPLSSSQTSETSGLDTVDNFTGQISAAASGTISASSFSSDTRTITVPSTAEFDDPFSICPAPANSTCLAPNQNVSIDGVINSDGSMTATEVEFLDPAPLTEELEGVIVTPISNNQFQMVAINGMGPASGDVTVGTLVTVNLNSASTYAVDPKNLGISTSTLGFQSSTDLVMGQTVMLQGGTVNFTNNSYSNYTRTLLRYSSIGGTVSAPSANQFTLTGVSPFLANLVNNSVLVLTFTTTAYDNISQFSGLSNGARASVRGLYLNPTSGAAQPVLAAKVRTH